MLEHEAARIFFRQQKRFGVLFSHGGGRIRPAIEDGYFRQGAANTLHVDCLLAAIHFFTEGAHGTGEHHIHTICRLVCVKKNLALLKFVLSAMNGDFCESIRRQVLELSRLRQDFYLAFDSHNDIFPRVLPDSKLRITLWPNTGQ